MGEDDGDKKGGTLYPYGRRGAAFYHAVVLFSDKRFSHQTGGSEGESVGGDKRLKERRREELC